MRFALCVCAIIAVAPTVQADIVVKHGFSASSIPLPLPPLIQPTYRNNAETLMVTQVLDDHFIVMRRNGERWLVEPYAGEIYEMLGRQFSDVVAISRGTFLGMGSRILVGRSTVNVWNAYPVTEATPAAASYVSTPAYVFPIQRELMQQPIREEPAPKATKSPQPSGPAIGLAAPTHSIRLTPAQISMDSMQLKFDGRTAANLKVNGKTRTCEVGESFTDGGATYEVQRVTPNAVELKMTQTFTLR